MSDKVPVGIVGIGVYLPKKIMTAKEISDATGGVWSEDAVRNKLGINQKYVPSDDPCDGTQEMGALAALDCFFVVSAVRFDCVVTRLPLLE